MIKIVLSVLVFLLCVSILSIDSSGFQLVDEKIWITETRSIDCSPLDHFQWMCFPVIDTRPEADQTAAFILRDSIIGDYIKLIKWSQGHWDSIYNMNCSWVNLDHTIHYTQGYVIDIYYPFEFTTSGYLAPTDTRIELRTESSGKPKENWIGYFLRDEMEVLHAFGPVLDSISVIRTERWSLFRNPSGGWLQAGSPKTLHYGEMVKVVCEHDCDFIWGDGDILPCKDGYCAPKFYSFVREEEYASMFVELQHEDPMPREIALFLDGVCRGASVVQDTLVQINAYVLEDTTLSDLDIELFYQDRESVKHALQTPFVDNHPYKRLYYIDLKRNSP